MKKFFLFAFTGAVLFGSSAFAMEQEKEFLDPEFELASLYRHIGNEEKEIATYERIVRKGDSGPSIGLACNNLGSCYFYGTDAVKDVGKSMICYQTAAEFGNTMGQYNWALERANGVHVPQNILEALFYFDLAAKKNDAKSKEMITAIIKTCTNLAESQNLGAIGLLINIYNKGIGVPQDLEKAEEVKKLYEKIPVKVELLTPILIPDGTGRGTLLLGRFSSDASQ